MDLAFIPLAFTLGLLAAVGVGALVIIGIAVAWDFIAGPKDWEP